MGRWFTWNVVLFSQEYNQEKFRMSSAATVGTLMTNIMNYIFLLINFTDSMRPPTSDAFRRPPSRPVSQRNGYVTTPKPATPKPVMETTLRYTTSAQGKRAPTPSAVAPALATTPPPPQPVEQEPSLNTF